MLGRRWWDDFFLNKLSGARRDDITWPGRRNRVPSMDSSDADGKKHKDH